MTRPCYATSREGWTALADARAAGYRVALLIPTNVQTRRDGTAVMGAGLARQAAAHRPDLPRRYGEALRRGEEILVDGDLICFPTKDAWRMPSTLKRIAVSCRQLIRIAPAFDFLLVPRLGCGLGGLSWDDVRPLLQRELEPIPSSLVFVGPATTPRSDVHERRT